MHRVLAIWLPQWPIQRLIHDRPELDGQPVILHQRTRGGLCVAACSRAARQRGVRIDMPLAEATAVGRPPVVGRPFQAVQKAASAARQDRPAKGDYFLEAYDPAADRRALDKLAVWCHRYSPLVGLEEADRPDTLLLDVSGIGPLFGGERSLVEQVIRSCRQLRLTVRLGLAGTVGAAWALAHYGPRAGSGIFFCEDAATVSRPASRQGPASLPTVSQPTSAEKTGHPLSCLPLAALRLPAATLATCERLGLLRIGDLLALPRAQLQSRFGSQLLLRLDQACGRAAEMIVAQRPPPDFTVEWLFEYPVQQPRAVQQVTRQLVQRLCFLLSQRRRGALHLKCRLDCQSAPAKSFQVGLFRPSARAEHLGKLVELQLEGLRLPAPVTGIWLRVAQHAPLVYRQRQLFDERPRRQGAPEVAALIDRLAGRLGRAAVVRCVLQSDAQPELAFREEPLVGESRVESRESRVESRESPVESPESRVESPELRVESRGLRVESSESRGRGRRKSRGGSSSATRDSGLSTRDSSRPLRLLAPPRVLQVLAVAPDGPPISFHYGGRKYDVARHWGPERIETGWWRRRGVRRDYYRVETTTGHHFWLFRCLQEGTWFLQGIFD